MTSYVRTSSGILFTLADYNAHLSGGSPLCPDESERLYGPFVGLMISCTVISLIATGVIVYFSCFFTTPPSVEEKIVEYVRSEEKAFVERQQMEREAKEMAEEEEELRKIMEESDFDEDEWEEEVSQSESDMSWDGRSTDRTKNVYPRLEGKTSAPYG